MGQQETMTVVATAGKGGGTLLRRMILVLAVAVLTAAMMAVNAMPAFAAGNGKGVPKGGQGDETDSYNPGESVNDAHGDLNNNVSNVRSVTKRDGRFGPGTVNN